MKICLKWKIHKGRWHKSEIQRWQLPRNKVAFNLHIYKQFHEHENKPIVSSLIFWCFSVFNIKTKIRAKNEEMTKSMSKRFTRNGPNSTLQIDDNKNIVSTPDGKIDQSKNIFLVILCLDFSEFQFNKSQIVFKCESLRV